MKDNKETSLSRSGERKIKTKQSAARQKMSVGVAFNFLKTGQLYSYTTPYSIYADK